MQEKPTYEELEALIKRLEKELANALAKVVELTKPYS
jgi:hypothetical protein|tara:strand:+ start:103 stop:213 length:111 start_codon:yes stop_codon:yes gene_type:complete